jgi:hypothetical protein
MHVVQWWLAWICILSELENAGLLDHHDEVFMELGTLCDDND